MISVVVGTRHLHALFGHRRGHRFNAVLSRTLDPLIGCPIFPPVKSPDDLAAVTVYDVLREFHARLVPLLCAWPAEIIRAHQNEMLRVGGQEYHYADFQVFLDDACRAVALHGLFPHGTIPSGKGRRQVYLPDLSLGVRCLGFFGRPPSATRTTMRAADIEEFAEFAGSIDWSAMDDAAVKQAVERLAALREVAKPPFAPEELSEALETMFSQPPTTLGELRERVDALPPMLAALGQNIESFARREVDGAVEHLWANRQAHDLRRVECHLCDSMLEVYRRAEGYWYDLRDKSSGGPAEEVFFKMQFERTPGEDVLVLDAIVFGFQGHRSLRRDNETVPSLGQHRLLAGRATRQGIAKPVASGLFPVNLWQRFQAPVAHFLLTAAERVGAEQCHPVYPNMPSEEEMRRLAWQAALAEGDCGFDVDGHAAQLQQFGIEAAVRRRIEQCQNLERLEQGEWAWDWTHAIVEYQSALYDDNIEQSLHLQEALDLYALHKRVLGLVEYVLIPEIKRKGIPGRGASAVWCAAFTGWQDKVGFHPGCASPALPLDQDDHASVEVEGHWLIEAHRREQAGDSGPLDLGSLLDGLVGGLNGAPPVTGVSITLTPCDPSAHARQLAALSQAGNAAAATMTLYLGKVALALRNYIEHGHDEVCGDRLRIDGTHYWMTMRGPKSTYQWVRDEAASVTPAWRHTPLLAGMLPTPPVPANGLLLSAASLRRCLTLLTCVLQGGIGHLRL